MLHLTTLPPLSLYIHIPWCVRKCPYCDFNSHEAKAELQESVYIDALLADLEQDLPRVWGRHIHTIFIGGGTPSLLSPEALERLISGLRARLRFRPDTEITLEANPGTIEAGKFNEFRDAGINRISIGIQSFDDDKLQRLGRIHGRREAIRAVELAHDAGFNSINLDLMFGLPQQSEVGARADLADAIALEPQHLSYYQLTLEPNTLFHHSPPSLPNDDTVWTIQEQGQAMLANHGYGQYEISAYARPGHQCQHNLNYWNFGDYLGIGAGAHGKLSDANSQSITRLWKLKHPQDYLAKAGSPAAIAGEQTLQRGDLGLEFMMNALRLTEGFETAQFTANTGLPITIVEPALKQAEEKGLIEWDIHRIRPTATGQRFLNDLLALFLPEEDA